MKHFDIMTLGVPILEFTRMELDKPFSQAGLFMGLSRRAIRESP